DRRSLRRGSPVQGWPSTFAHARPRSGAYNAGVMTIYDRTVARLSRREIMKLGCLAGAAALAPLTGRRLLAKPIFNSYPFTLGVASGDPLPDGVVLWTRLAPAPLEGGGMPMAVVEVGWEIARDARF